MSASPKRPALRVLETLVVPDQRHGKLLLLRDLQGIAPGYARIPPPLIPIIARFDGEHTCEEVASEASEELGHEVTPGLVESLADELERGLFLEGDAYQAARAEVVRAFAEADVRPASHAGGAYEGDATRLARYLDDACLGAAGHEARGTSRSTKGAATKRAAAVGDEAGATTNRRPQRSSEAASRTAKRRGRVTALVAPHIDPWRGALGYGRSYGALGAELAEQVDTFVVFGTSHAPMRQPYAICRKAFATPLGDVPADLDAIDRLAKRAKFDVYFDLFNHRREHAIEFQVVLLKHLLGDRPAKIIPILAGLGEHQARGTDPAKDARAESLIDGVRELVAERPGRVVVVAGADMAHVGPRFGDREAYDEGRRSDLEAIDRASLTAACDADAAGFWGHVARDLDTRRVCGLAPIYALLRTLPELASARDGAGDLVHYEQTVDAEDGSIVSHAGIVFRAT